MHIAASRIIDVLCNLQERIKAFLDADCAHVAHEIGFAVLESWIRGDRPKCLEVWSIANDKYIARVEPTSTDRQRLVAVVRRHHRVAKMIGHALKPELGP